MSGPVQTFPPVYDLGHVPSGAVLVVAPHPDDEILGCGGAIALHVRRGDRVHVVLVTSGEAGGEASSRVDESNSSASRLGAAAVTCLGVPDGAVEGDEGLAARLAEMVKTVAPRVVYAPSPFEMHPDHVATLDAVAAALSGHDGVQLLLYEVNTECMATFLLDITPVADAKRAALEAFASQLGRIDIVAKADARARARTVNVDIAAITHAEGFMELAPRQVPSARSQLANLARTLGLLSP